MVLRAADWLRCLAVASSVLWLRELAKLNPAGGRAPLAARLGRPLRRPGTTPGKAYGEEHQQHPENERIDANQPDHSQSPGAWEEQEKHGEQDGGDAGQDQPQLPFDLFYSKVKYKG